MGPLRHILVATDFGEASRRALEAAVDLAALFEAKLTVVHVLEPLPYPYPVVGPAPLATTPLDGLRPGRLEGLDREVDSIRPRVANVQAMLRDGSPWREVVSVAREIEADLIVVGSHGRHGLPRWMLGSVAEKIVRTSPIPVLTVRPSLFADRRQAGRSADELDAIAREAEERVRRAVEAT